MRPGMSREEFNRGELVLFYWSGILNLPKIASGFSNMVLELVQ